MVATFGLLMAFVFAGGVGASWLLAGQLGLASVGAMGGAAVGAGVLLRPWRNKERWKLDHLVIGGLVGLAVARLGCLFEGCDFGRPTEGAPSVVHEAGTRAFDVHVVQYGLEPTAQASLAVHPFALYLAVWGFAAALYGQWRRSRHDKPGRPAVAAAALFLVGGGAIEWLREPAVVLELSDGLSAYPFIYWAGAICVGLLWWRIEDRESGVES